MKYKLILDYEELDDIKFYLEEEIRRGHTAIGNNPKATILIKEWKKQLPRNENTLKKVYVLLGEGGK